MSSVPPLPPIQPPDDDRRLALEQSQSRLLTAQILAQSRQAQRNVRADFTYYEALLLLTRYQTSPMTATDIKRMPISDLTHRERYIVDYLQRNPELLTNISRYRISDPLTRQLWASQALAVLKPPAAPAQSTARHIALPPELDPLAVFDPQHPETEVLALLEKIRHDLPAATPQNPPPANIPGQAPWALHISQLQAFSPRAGSLGEREVRQVAFLQSASIQQLLANLTLNTHGYFTPEIIRALISILWAPTIARGSSPASLLLFERKDQREKIFPIDPNTPAAAVFFQHAYHPDAEGDVFERVTLSAQDIRELCRHLKLKGGITLGELKRYQPRNETEVRLLRYLSQLPVFQALASLDGEDNTLDPEDIRLALSEHALILSDTHLTLVIEP